MKQKIKVEIHKSGSNNNAILAMVAAHNEGEVVVEIPDIKGLLKWKKVEYPSMNRFLRYEGFSGNVNGSNEATIHIFEEENASPTITLEWIEIHELTPAANADDIRDINI